MNKSRLLPKGEKKEVQEVPNILAISTTSPPTGVYLAWVGSWWTSTICLTWWLQRIRDSGVTCCGRMRKLTAHITDTRESKKQELLKKKPASLLLFFSCSVISDFLWPQGLQHPRLPCPSPFPGACSDMSLNGHESIESVMPSNHLILCHPLILLPSIFPSIRAFSNELAFHIRWPKYWSFSFSISTSNEYSGLISFRIDWLDFLAVQGTLKNLLQQHSLKVSNSSALSLL